MFSKQIPPLNPKFLLPFTIWVAIFFLGCNPQEVRFRPNELYVASLSKDSIDQEVTALANSALEQVDLLFGKPNSPTWPSEIANVVDMAKVKRSAGPVGRDKDRVEYGLFRKHCVQCHGTTGDGQGPASALLAPYPRDFRRGSFKFKSTPIGKKPTHVDLVRTLENGLPGTAMPAFGTLNRSTEFAEDVDALAHYVRYLSVRGEVERRLISAIVNQEDAAEQVMTIASKVAENWSKADSQSVNPQILLTAWTPEDQMAAIERGKAVFLSELTACSKCHGKLADGKGTSQDFDEWTKDWTIRAGIDPSKKAEWKPMKRFGALKPVLDSPRNLTLGAFRGGETRGDIYLRIVLGIEGSPMPAIARKENDNPGITEEGIRDLVEYVFSLSNPISEGNPTLDGSVITNDKEAEHEQSN